MVPTRSMLIACAITACGGPAAAPTRPPPVASEPPPAPTREPPPTPTPEPAPAPAAPVSCAPLDALAWGEVLYDRRVDDPIMKQPVDVGAMMPAIEAEHDVIAVTAADVGRGEPTLAVFLARNDELRAEVGPKEILLAAAGCDPQRGWTLVTKPYAAGYGDAFPRVLHPDRLALPGGGTVTSFAVAEYSYSTPEMYTSLQVLGPEGEYGHTDRIGGKIVAEGGGGQMFEQHPIGGSGWYPAGDARAYVSISNVHGPDEEGVMIDLVAVVDSAGFHDPGRMKPRYVPPVGWVALGRGPQPAWCTRGAIRCVAIDPDYRVVPAKPKGAAPYAWLAGVWVGEDPKAVAKQLEAAGGDARKLDWYDVAHEEEPRRGPGGKPPVSLRDGRP